LVFADEDAGQPGEFLRYGIDARALGMGRAYTAGADGSSAIFWNAAALAHLNRMEAGFMHQSLYFNTNYQYAGFAYPYFMKKDVALAASFVSLSTTDIERREAETGELLGSFDNQEAAVYIGGNYFKAFYHGLYSAGLATKWVYQSIDANNGSGIGADISLQYHPIFPFGLTYLPLKYTLPLRVGLNFQNLMAPSITIDNEADKFPSSIRFGLAYSKVQNLFFGYIPTGKANIELSYDLEKVMAEQERALDHFIGLEVGYPINDFYPAARFGFNTSDEGMSMGTGVIWNWEKAKIGFDYAFVSHPDLETSHRIGVKVAFGQHQDLRKNASREPKQLASEYSDKPEVLWKYLTDYAYDHENPKEEYDNVAKALVQIYQEKESKQPAEEAEPEEVVEETPADTSAQAEQVEVEEVAVETTKKSKSERVIQRLFQFTGGLSFVDILFTGAQSDFYEKDKIGFASVAKEYKKNESRFKDDEAKLVSLNNYAETYMMESQYNDDDAWQAALDLLLLAEGDLSKLKTSDQSPENHRREYLKGVCYFRLNEEDKAIASFKFVDRERIHKTLSKINLAVLNLANGNAGDAKNNLSEVSLQDRQLPKEHPPYPYFSDLTLIDDILFLEAVAGVETDKEAAIQKVNEILFLYPETDLALMLLGQKDEFVSDPTALQGVFSNYKEQFNSGRIDAMHEE